MKRKKQNRTAVRALQLAMAAAIAACLLLTAVSAMAETLISGVLEIRYAADVDGKSPISGAGFKLTRIAALTEEGTYRLLVDIGEGRPAGTVVDGQQTDKIDPVIVSKAVEPLKAVPAAKTGEAAASHDLSDTSDEGADGLVLQVVGTTDSTGTARFEDLAAGLWLCEETKAAAGFKPSSPVIVPVPSVTVKDGQTVRQEAGEAVILNPKPVRLHLPSVSASGGPGGSRGTIGSSVRSTVKTGDKSRAAVYAAAALVSLAAAAGVIVTDRRRMR